MEKSPPLVSTPLLSEAYCRTPLLLFRLPVLETPCTPWHELELSPPPVTVNVWLEPPLLLSCSVPWLTCAMAGTAATTTIASKAANNIIFFNFTPPYERASMTFGILSSTLFPVNGETQLFSTFLKTT